jgi:hypothetical protein
LKILADREVAPQLGPLKSTVLQLDSTFSERDYGAGTFREFMQKMEQAGLVHLRRIDRGYLVEVAEGDTDKSAAPAVPQDAPVPESAEITSEAVGEETTTEATPLLTQEQVGTSAEALGLLKLALAAAAAKSPNRPLYMRHIRQALRAANKDFDERRYGFRGFLDFLHQAQREGWLRLQRDRKGVWRVFQVIPSTAVPQEALAEETPVVLEFAAMPGESISSLAGEDEVLPEPTITEVVGEPESEAGEALPGTEEDAAIAAEPDEAPPKPRRTRAARGTSARARKTPARRKPKSSDGE